jgi:hypothetical protein
MAMNPTALKAAIKTKVYNGLVAGYGAAVAQGTNYTPVADAQWMILAEAISGIAFDIVTEITTNATVLPGIPTNTGATTGTGQIA